MRTLGPVSSKSSEFSLPPSISSAPDSRLLCLFLPPSDIQTKLEPASPSSSVNSEASLLSADSPSQVVLSCAAQQPSPGVWEVFP